MDGVSARECRSGRTLALRVNAKLGTLSGSECILLPLVVSAYEVVKCRKRIALLESLNDEGDLPTRLSVGDLHAFHDFGGHEAQADRHDGRRVETRWD